MNLVTSLETTGKRWSLDKDVTTATVFS